MKFLKKLLTGIAIVVVGMIAFFVILFGVIPSIEESGDDCTVTKLTGETIVINDSELVDLISNDVIAFENEYKGAKITGEGVIDEISKGSSIGTVYTDKEYYTVRIDCVEIETRAEVFQDFRVGDKVRYRGVIERGFVMLEVDQEYDSHENPSQNIFHIDD